MISFVIPVFNEEENVQPLYDAIQEVMNDIAQEYEIIFVDDGSTDNTLLNLTSLLNNGNGNGELRIIELQQNYGQTPALLAGFANIK